MKRTIRPGLVSISLWGVALAIVAAALAVCSSCGTGGEQRPLFSVSASCSPIH